MALWYHAVAEANHDIQNPTSAEKILVAGRAADLGPGSRLLDVAGGRGGPAILLAREFGCHVTLVERAPEFETAARERIRAAGLEQLIETACVDALEFEPEPESYDAVFCLGASFIWGDLEGAASALLPAVRPGGRLAVGEPYWRRLPLPDDYPDRDEPFTTLAGTVAKLERAGLHLVSLVAASEDDWDRYESLHWQTIEEWAAANPDHPDREEIVGRMRGWRERYFRFERGLLGWAIFVGRKPA